MTENLIKLYDGRGNVVTEFHPNFNSVKRDILFGAGGYNPVPERRGSSGGLYANSGSETWAKQRDRLKQMWDARDAVAMDWIGGMLARVTRYVAGRLHCKSETGDEQLDEMYDSYFHAWCGDERDEAGRTICDITGRHRFLKMVQMAFLAHMVDGDYGFIEIDPQFSPTGRFCLQSIEADRIGSPLEASTDETYIGGVKVDVQTGRILFYRIFRRTRLQQYIEPREIPPENFIHVFDPERSDEYRGRSKLVRCLNDLRDIREWIEAEKIAGKVQSQWAAMVGLKDPFKNTGPAAWTGTSPDGTPTQEAQWGKILKMAEGEAFSMISPSQRPSGAFLNFVQVLIRKMAVALELSYGLMWDLATLGGVSQRIEVQSDLRKIQSWQDNLIKGLILDRVRNKVIAEGIATGALPPTPNWRKCSWNFGPFITADLGYEMDADIQSIAHGIAEIDAVAAKHTGKRAIEVFAANAKVANEALMMAGQTGIPPESFAKGLYPDLTIQRAAFVQSQLPPPPPPEPIDIQVIGDKGLGKVIEIIKAVKEGSLDRDSAVQTLVKAFGMPEEAAEEIVPEEPTPAEMNRVNGAQPNGANGKNGSNGKSAKATSPSRKFSLHE